MANEASILFEQIRSGGCDYVREIVARGEREQLILDFKRLSHPDGAVTVGKNDKENYAAALSGFANSAGGVIVWGVDARRSQPVTEVPIHAVSEFVKQLESLLPVAVTRSVEGVENISLPIRGDEGFAATYIPESAAAPHRAEFHLKRYFRRVGDSFVPMEHYELEDMFGRRQRAVLQPTVTYHDRSIRRERHEYQLVVTVENLGRAMATHFRLDLEFPRVLLDQPGRAALGLFRVRDHRTDPGLVILSARNVDIGSIFPGEQVQLTPVRGEADIDYVFDPTSWRIWQHRELTLEIFVDDSPPRRTVIPLSTLNKF